MQTLIDHIAGNSTLDEFLEGFPSVTRKQAVQFNRSLTVAALKAGSEHEMYEEGTDEVC